MTINEFLSGYRPFLAEAVGSNVIAISEPWEYEYYLDQHYSGICRYGIFPYDQFGYTNLAVIRFLQPPTPSMGNSLDSALQVQKALKQWNGTDLQHDKKGISLSDVEFNGIQTYLFRGKSLDREEYELLFFFSAPLKIEKAWITLKAILLGLELDRHTLILPRPAIGPIPSIEDAYWLPWFGGKPDLILDERGGGVEQGLTTYITVNGDGVISNSGMPDTVQRISQPKLTKLIEILDPLISVAQKLADQTKKEAVEHPKEATPFSPSDEVVDADRPIQVNVKLEGSAIPALEKQTPLNAEYWLSQITDSLLHNRLATLTALWQQTSRAEILRAFFEDEQINVNFISPRFVKAWAELMVSITGLTHDDVYSTAKLSVQKGLLHLTKLSDHLLRAFHLGFNAAELGKLAARWLDANGRSVGVDSKNRLTLHWAGQDTLVENTYPFGTQIWELTGRGVIPSNSDDFWYGLKNELYSMIPESKRIKAIEPELAEKPKRVRKQSSK